MKTNLYTFIAVTLLLIIVSSCHESDQMTNDSASYSDSLTIARKVLNKSLKNKPNSPIPIAKREQFVGLNYFPPNENYRVNAKIVPADSIILIQMATSTGEVREMIPYAVFQFKIHSTPYELTGFMEVNASSPELFIPFFDETNGTQTYAGGRYLQVRLNESDSVTIDFNSAYNPYCHYNTNFSCPIPPSENSLNVSIESGEQTLY